MRYQIWLELSLYCSLPGFVPNQCQLRFLIVRTICPNKTSVLNTMQYSYSKSCFNAFLNLLSDLRKTLWSFVLINNEYNTSIKHERGDRGCNLQYVSHHMTFIIYALYIHHSPYFLNFNMLYPCLLSLVSWLKHRWFTLMGIIWNYISQVPWICICKNMFPHKFMIMCNVCRTWDVCVLYVADNHEDYCPTFLNF